MWFWALYSTRLALLAPKTINWITNNRTFFALYLQVCSTNWFYGRESLNYILFVSYHSKESWFSFRFQILISISNIDFVFDLKYRFCFRFEISISFSIWYIDFGFDLIYPLEWALFLKSLNFVLTPELWLWGYKIRSHTKFEVAEAKDGQSTGHWTNGLAILEAENSRSSDRLKIKILLFNLHLLIPKWPKTLKSD